MPSERILFDSATVRIGHFVCAPDEPHWHTENIINGTVVVFPSVPVRIHQADREPVLADRNVVMYYNDGQPYRRGLLHDRGDSAVWIALKGDHAHELVRECRASVSTEPDRPFDLDHGPSPAGCYLRHQALSHRLVHDEPASSLLAEEAAITLVRDLLAAEARAHGRTRARPSRHETERSRRRTVEDVRELLATDPGFAWSLDEIVRRVCVSPSHLCRMFKQQLGVTIHQYLTQLRLREAAEAVLAGERDLAMLAVRLGFCTHSHFTENFRRGFGVPPKRLRDADVLSWIARSGLA
ncbi:MAG: helix-turn-helix transcriptional regulator [Planctomycetota bacterium]|nr:MAG: helix-turn-helix transcriptional regulator [Planctomycetota bacterium]